MYDAQETFNRIKDLLNRKKITQEKMLSEIGLSINVLRRSATRLNGMYAANIFAIASFLDCSADYLLGLTDNPERNK